MHNSAFRFVLFHNFTNWCLFKHLLFNDNVLKKLTAIGKKLPAYRILYILCKKIIQQNLLI